MLVLVLVLVLALVLALVLVVLSERHTPSCLPFMSLRKKEAGANCEVV